MRFSCVLMPALSYWYLPFRERPWAGKDVIAIEGMLSDLTPDEQEALWQKAKQEER